MKRALILHNGRDSQKILRILRWLDRRGQGSETDNPSRTIQYFRTWERTKPFRAKYYCEIHMTETFFYRDERNAAWRDRRLRLVRDPGIQANLDDYDCSKNPWNKYHGD